jgi:hypothetical protein
MLGKLNICMQRNEVRTLYYTIYKNEIKWIRKLNLTTKTVLQCPIFRTLYVGMLQEKALGHHMWQWFLGYTTKTIGKKGKKQTNWTTSELRFSVLEGNNQPYEKATYRMEKNILNYISNK